MWSSDTEASCEMTGLLRRKESTATTADGESGVTIRRAGPADVDAIARLARLDASRPPGGEVLVAEVAGEPWAALSLDDFHAVADPFRPSGELLFLLVEHARNMQRGRPRERRRLRRPRFADAPA
jgi:hypothetical protein